MTGATRRRLADREGRARAPLSAVLLLTPCPDERIPL
jgi:hypothetical protein